MKDPRVKKFAHILVDYSANIQPGDRVQIDATLAALPLVEAMNERIIERGGHAYPMLELPKQQSTFYKHANLDQLHHVNEFRMLAYENFESRFRIHSSMDLQDLKDVDPAKQKEAGLASKPILETQCLECHNSKDALRHAGLNLETLKLAMTTGRQPPVIKPGDPKNSLLIQAMENPATHPVNMPPSPDKLWGTRMKILKKWIREGADWPEEIRLIRPQDWKI